MGVEEALEAPLFTREPSQAFFYLGRAGEVDRGFATVMYKARFSKEPVKSVSGYVVLLLMMKYTLNIMTVFAEELTHCRFELVYFLIGEVII